MNAAHLHLLFNHFPVILTLVAFAILLWGIVRGSDEIRKVALGLFVLAAVATAATFFTGEPAEDVVKRLPGVSESMMDQHEDAAKVAAATQYLLGLAALAGLVLGWRRGRLPPAITAVVTLLALLAVSVTGRASNLGGKIHHPEAVSAAPTAAEGSHGDD